MEIDERRQRIMRNNLKVLLEEKKQYIVELALMELFDSRKKLTFKDILGHFHYLDDHYVAKLLYKLERVYGKDCYFKRKKTFREKATDIIWPILGPFFGDTATISDSTPNQTVLEYVPSITWTRTQVRKDERYFELPAYYIDNEQVFEIDPESTAWQFYNLMKEWSTLEKQRQLWLHDSYNVVNTNSFIIGIWHGN